MVIFTNKKKAEAYRDYWNAQAKKQDVNLRHRVLKKEKRYIVNAETKKR